MAVCLALCGWIHQKMTHLTRPDANLPPSTLKTVSQGPSPPATASEAPGVAGVNAGLCILPQLSEPSPGPGNQHSNKHPPTCPLESGGLSPESYKLPSLHPQERPRLSKLQKHTFISDKCNPVQAGGYSVHTHGLYPLTPIWQVPESLAHRSAKNHMKGP